MRSWKKILARVTIGIAALLASCLLLLSVIDWNFAKPWISERVSQAIGREFAIHGALTLSWERPDGAQSGWRRFVPWPHFRAHDLTLANAGWAHGGRRMLAARQVDFTLNLPSLLRKTVRVPSLLLTEADLRLEIDPDGRKNWVFKESESRSSWRFDLQDLSLDGATVRLLDTARKADVVARLHTLDDGSVAWNISGLMNDEPVRGNGNAGALLSLGVREEAYPIEAVLKVGKSTISAHGTITNPRRVSALDLNLKLSGASMAQLFPLSGLVLPETPEFSTEGRVVGSIKEDDFHLRYENFTGKVGSSDIGGTLEYLRTQPRAQLRGAVVSQYLNLADLAALLGTDSEQARQKRGDTTRQPPDKVLPAGAFRTGRWDALDVQVRFTGRRIVRREELPLENMVANVELKQGVLGLAPLSFGVAGGKISTDLSIDGNGDVARARMKVSARGLKLNRLFPEVKSMNASLGELHVNAQLTGAGNSFAALAASANGEAKAFVSEGTISKFILEAMGLNIGSVIVTQLFGDHQVRLNCLASDFAVKDGLMQTRTFVADTDDALIEVGGHIDLGRERLALTIRPESKGVRVFSLRSPLHVQGSFKNPEVGVDKAAVGAKAALATAIGVVASPFAALLALVNPGPEEASPCPQLLAQAREKPVAPAPGKAAQGKR